MWAQQEDVFKETLKFLLSSSLDISDGERESVVRVLKKLVKPERWGYVNINPEQQEILLDAIIGSPRPHQTMRVWAAALKYIKYGTNELMAGRSLLSKETGITPQEISRSFGYLVEFGAFRRIQKGHYKLNPHIIWLGPLVGRSAVAKNFTPLSPATNPPHTATKEDSHV